MSNQEFNPTHLVLYLGVRISVATKKGKNYKIHKYIVLDEYSDSLNEGIYTEEELKKEKYESILFPGKNLLNSAYPGSIYKVRKTSDGSWVAIGLFFGRLPEKEYRQKLQMEHHTCLNFLAEQSKKQVGMSKNEVFELLEPIKDLYKRCKTAREQTLILAYILRYITT